MFSLSGRQYEEAVSKVVTDLFFGPTLPWVRARWSREQIRAARMAPLLPLLQKRGLQLLEQGAGNFLLPAFPGLIVKDSYWRWPQRDRAGNTIDFFVQVLGLSFHQAMQQITAAKPWPANINTSPPRAS
jgi:hypothetical protein